jgi:hypothetical protein
MKTSILVYASGLILILVSIILALNNPNSGRTQLIAGGITFIGIILNIAGFVMKRTKLN